VQCNEERIEDQEEPDADAEGGGVDLGQQPRADGHADEARHDEHRDAPPVDMPPDQRYHLHLRDQRADDDERCGHRRRDDVEPDAERRYAGAEAGEAVDEATREGAEEDQDNLLMQHGVEPSRRTVAGCP
jgi:hypothetical protein